MNLVFKKMLVPICVGIMLGSQVIAYFTNKELNLFIIATVCFLTPGAIQELKPDYENFSIFRKVFLVIGLIIMTLGFYNLLNN